jgi:hypothetical protein
MTIEFRGGMITRDDLRAEPDKIFVFGDNMARFGLGGQAASMRGEPNAIGVATLYAPGNFYRDGDPAALKAVMDDLMILPLLLRQGKTIVVPSAGIGTGLARLPQSYPALHQLIRAFFTAASGRACPWE